MAGDLDITERVVWSQQPTAQAAHAAGPQVAFGMQRLATAAAPAPPSGVDQGITQKHERVIHQYGRLGIAATPITSALSRSAQAAAASPSPAYAPVPSAAAPSDMSDVERLGLEAHRIRESAEYRAEKANRSRAGQPWDMPGCGSAAVAAAPGVPHGQQAARAPAAGAAGAPAPDAGAPGPTSAFLEGSVAVGIIIVQGPTPDLQFSDAERAKVVAEVQNGLSFYATANPAGMITFVYDVQNVTLNKPADHNLQPGQMEPYFRDPAMGALGYSADWNGLVNYVEAIRTRFNTRWTYAAFFTKYPVSWFAYASIGGPRLVMDYANDGWGPDNIDRVFAHETGHIFGAPDEYAASNCNCGGAWGRFGAPNGNCETCAPNGGVQCLMKGNDFTVCSFSRLHWGWQPRLVLGDMGYSAGGWRVDRHPRFVVDVNNDRRADLVGFGDAGVLISRAQPDGSYPSPTLVIKDYGYVNGGWRVEKHPRFMADTNGDRLLDIVGFGEAGVLVSRANANGTYGPQQLLIKDFGYTAGGWRVEKHPRLVVDTNGDGRADIVGFGDAGCHIALAQADGSYAARRLVIQDYGYTNGGWRVEKHPRFMADTTGSRRLDIVGFGEAGVLVSRQAANGTFGPQQLLIKDFGYTAGGWRVEKHPRFVLDITGDGRADIVGFGEAGVIVSLAQADGSYSAPKLVLNDFGYTAGGWRVDKHPRMLADTTGDGLPDIVGFGEAGVIVARNIGGGRFAQPALVLKDFGYANGGWRVDKHPRFLADTNADGKADIVGFGEAGVLLALSS